MNLRLNFTARTKVTAISETKNKRRRSKTVRLQETCREKGDKRWHWFPMIGYCQRYFIPIGILPTCPKIQSKLAVVPFRKRHSVIPVSRVCIFGNIE